MWRGRAGGMGCCGELSEDGERLPPSLASGSCRAGGVRARGVEGVSVQLTPPPVLALLGARDLNLPLPGIFTSASTAPCPDGWEELGSKTLAPLLVPLPSPFWKSMEWAGWEWWSSEAKGLCSSLC